MFMLMIHRPFRFQILVQMETLIQKIAQNCRLSAKGQYLHLVMGMLQWYSMINIKGQMNRNRALLLLLFKGKMGSA